MTYTCPNPECGRVHATWRQRCDACMTWDLVPTSIANARTAAAVRPVVIQGHWAQPAPPPIEPPRIVTAPVAPPARPIAQQLRVSGGVGRAASVPLSAVTEESYAYNPTGIRLVDELLDGGLVVSGVYLLASSPGSGKSSVTLQILAALDLPVLYATGEETIAQIAKTARRIGAAADKVLIRRDAILESVLEHARADRAHVIAIDSLQKLYSLAIDSVAGSRAQIAFCTARLVEYAKDNGTTVWIIGHVTGDGSVAGPKTIEHDVDVVFELERGRRGERTLRYASGKNRFGLDTLSLRFEMTTKGLVPIELSDDAKVIEDEPDAEEPGVH